MNATQRPMQERLPLEARKRILERQIAWWSGRGYRVVSRTDTTAQLTRPKQFSCLWATLWFLLFGIGLLVYVFYYMSKRDDVVYIEVDDWGKVRRR